MPLKPLAEVISGCPPPAPAQPGLQGQTLIRDEVGGRARGEVGHHREVPGGSHAARAPGAPLRPGSLPPHRSPLPRQHPPGERRGQLPLSPRRLSRSPGPRQPGGGVSRARTPHSRAVNNLPALPPSPRLPSPAPALPAAPRPAPRPPPPPPAPSPAASARWSPVLSRSSGTGENGTAGSLGPRRASPPLLVPRAVLFSMAPTHSRCWKTAAGALPSPARLPPGSCRRSPAPLRPPALGGVARAPRLGVQPVPPLAGNIWGSFWRRRGGCRGVSCL